MVAGSAVQQGVDPAEFVGASQFLGERLEPAEKGGNLFDDGGLGIVRPRDDVCGEAVPAGPPFVFLDVPSREPCERRPGGERPSGFDHQALCEGSQCPDFVQGGETVADARFDGAKPRGGTHIVAKLVDVLHDSGLELVGDETFVGLPIGQLRRDSGGGELLEHHGAVGGVSGEPSIPPGAGGRERLKVRLVAQELLDDWQCGVLAVHADMDVNTVDQHLTAPPLGPIDQPAIAIILRVGLCRSGLKGVGSRAEQAHMCRGDPAEQGAELMELRERRGDRVMYPGDEFNGVLEKLPVDVRGLRRARDGLEERVRLWNESSRAAVDESELPFNPNGPQFGVGKGEFHRPRLLECPRSLLFCGRIVCWYPHLFAPLMRSGCDRSASSVRRPHSADRGAYVTNRRIVSVKIRLARFGKIHAPQYRVVVVDSRKKRNGRFIEEVGRYDPTQEPSFVEIASERVQYWLSVGAQPSDQVHRLLELTGDWATFTGEGSPEGSLKKPEPKPEYVRDENKKSVVIPTQKKAAEPAADAEQE